MLELVILDVNETLFPLDPVADRMAEVGLPGQLDVWFARVLRDGIAAAAADRFAPFGELGRHHLAMLLDGHPEPDTAIAHVLDGFGQVHPHPDVAPGLHALRDAGIPTVALTNGSAELTRAFLARADLTDLVAEVHDVTPVGRWKPAAAAYRFVLDRHGVGAHRAAMVAVHPWDLLGAQAAGLVTGWLNRDGDRYPAVFGQPDVTASDLPELVMRLLVPDS